MTVSSSSLSPGNTTDVQIKKEKDDCKTAMLAHTTLGSVGLRRSVPVSFFFFFFFVSTIIATVKCRIALKLGVAVVVVVVFVFVPRVPWLCIHIVVNSAPSGW